MEVIALTSENPGGWYGGVLQNDGRDFSILAESGTRAYYFDRFGNATGQTKQLSVDDQGDILDAIEVVLPEIEIVTFLVLPAERINRVEFISEIPI